MSNSILTEIRTLLQETDVVLTTSEPDADTWERYSQQREVIFSRLQNLLQNEVFEERTVVQNALRQVLEKDGELLQQLEKHLSQCRQALTAVAKANHTFKNSVPLLPHLLDRGA